MIDLSFNVRVEQGEFELDVADTSHVEVLGLFGASGAGKTTLLEAIAGLRRPTRGEIRVGDRVLFDSQRGIDRRPQDRHIGYVPQDVLLFPHLDVRGNLRYGMRDNGRRPPSGPTLEQCAEILDLTTLIERRVSSLSGGERQRVAIGRALMTSPLILLLDEPLAAVDRARRERILPYLLRIRTELHVPMIYVTHDAGELREISDRVLIVAAGRVTAGGPPSTVLP
jgi:molybdate transport system ATP-binding protein